MRLLLDTHAFIWWDSQPERLSGRALELCCDPQNQLVVSVATAWEMQIKTGLGKLHLSLPLSQIFERQQQENSVSILPISLAHVIGLGELPSHHTTRLIGF